MTDKGSKRLFEKLKSMANHYKKYRRGTKYFPMHFISDCLNCLSDLVETIDVYESSLPFDLDDVTKKIKQHSFDKPCVTFPEKDPIFISWLFWEWNVLDLRGATDPTGQIDYSEDFIEVTVLENAGGPTIKKQSKIFKDFDSFSKYIKTLLNDGFSMDKAIDVGLDETGIDMTNGEGLFVKINRRTFD